MRGESPERIGSQRQEIKKLELIDGSPADIRDSIFAMDSDDFSFPEKEKLMKEVYKTLKRAQKEFWSEHITVEYSGIDSYDSRSTDRRHHFDHARALLKKIHELRDQAIIANPERAEKVIDGMAQEILDTVQVGYRGHVRKIRDRLLPEKKYQEAYEMAKSVLEHVKRKAEDDKLIKELRLHVQDLSDELARALSSVDSKYKSYIFSILAEFGGFSEELNKRARDRKVSLKDYESMCKNIEQKYGYLKLKIEIDQFKETYKSDEPEQKPDLDRGSVAGRLRDYATNDGLLKKYQEADQIAEAPKFVQEVMAVVDSLDSKSGDNKFGLRGEMVNDDGSKRIKENLLKALKKKNYQEVVAIVEVLIFRTRSNNRYKDPRDSDYSEVYKVERDLEELKRLCVNFGAIIEDMTLGFDEGVFSRATRKTLSPADRAYYRARDQFEHGDLEGARETAAVHLIKKARTDARKMLDRTKSLSAQHGDAFDDQIRPIEELLESDELQKVRRAGVDARLLGDRIRQWAARQITPEVGRLTLADTSTGGLSLAENGGLSLVDEENEVDQNQ